MRDFLTSTVAALNVLAEQLLANRQAMKLNNQIGPGKRTTKFVNTSGPAPVLGVKSRQVERAEGFAAMKRQSTLFKKRSRDIAGNALAKRVREREERELSRRDNRMPVAIMLERSRGAGKLSRGAFS